MHDQIRDMVNICLELRYGKISVNNTTILIETMSMQRQRWDRRVSTRMLIYFI